VAVIVPWILHSPVKPDSLEWECIPDPAPPCKITLPQQNSSSQETTGEQEWQENCPALVILKAKVINIKIDEKSLYPESLIHLKLVTATHESSSYQVFHSFYKEMWSKFFISTKAKNLFLSLAD
jgi:hypothetical protein